MNMHPISARADYDSMSWEDVIDAWFQFHWDVDAPSDYDWAACQDDGLTPSEALDKYVEDRPEAQFHSM